MPKAKPDQQPHQRANMLPDQPPWLTHTIHLRSRYSETDKMGYVYHGRFLEYFEVARTEFIRQAGLPYADLESRGIMLPVRRVEIAYNRPVYYDELMEVSILIYRRPDVKLETYYTVHAADSAKPNVTGWVQLVFIDSNARRPMDAPQEFLDAMDAFGKQ